MKLYDKLFEHFVDSTAVASAGNPILAAIEVFAAGMTNETSMHARMAGTTLVYMGLGSVYSRGRDLSKRVFNVTKESKESVKKLHDALYSAFYIGITQPPFYYALGARDWKQIAVGAAGAAAVQIFLGPIAGYTIDTYRDFTGIKESERLPYFVKDMSPA